MITISAAFANPSPLVLTFCYMPAFPLFFFSRGSLFGDLRKFASQATDSQLKIHEAANRVCFKHSTVENHTRAHVSDISKASITIPAGTLKVHRTIRYSSRRYENDGGARNEPTLRVVIHRDVILFDIHDVFLSTPPVIQPSLE